LGTSKEGVAGIPRKPNQKNPDLSDAAAKKNATFRMKYLRREETVNGKEHRASFKGSAEELESRTQRLEFMKSK
jgi:hypothetical protein